MKWNWGKGIVLSFVLFCSFIIYIVIKAFQQDVDLVSETYYLEELAYQQRINEKSNLANSGEEIAIGQDENDVKITFPEAFKTAKGEIHFYHPSRAIFDKFFPIDLTNGQQLVSKSELIKGRFKVKINWEVDGTAYFKEGEIFIK